MQIYLYFLSSFPLLSLLLDGNKRFQFSPSCLLLVVRNVLSGLALCFNLFFLFFTSSILCILLLQPHFLSPHISNSFSFCACFLSSYNFLFTAQIAISERLFPSKCLHLFYSSCRIYYLTTQPNLVQTILLFQILSQDLLYPQHRNICIFLITLEEFSQVPHVSVLSC